MGCKKILHLSEAPPIDSPMQDAVYVSAQNKIYGTSGPYVLKCNAVTGAIESSVRVTSPVYGPCRICYNSATAMLYVSVRNPPNLQWYCQAPNPVVAQPNRDIYPVNPATMAVGTRWFLEDTYVKEEYSNGTYFGPGWIGSGSDNMVYIIWHMNDGDYAPIWFDPANLATHKYYFGSAPATFTIEQCATGGGFFFMPWPYSRQLAWGSLGWVTNFGYSDNTYSLSPYHPVGLEYCTDNSMVYVVCGDTNLIKVDPSGPSKVALNLAPVDAAADPCRIRQKPGTGLLYLPCMTSNLIIIWDTATDTGTAQTGFANPVDVVFTASKAFAVQNSGTPLKEIT